MTFRPLRTDVRVLVATTVMGAMSCSEDSVGPGELTLEVTPAAAQAAAGDTVRVNATVRRGGLVVDDMRVTWSTDIVAAPVDSNGLVTLPLEWPRVVTVYATAGSLSDSAKISTVVGCVSFCGSWSASAGMTFPRTWVAIATSSTKLYVAGGNQFASCFQKLARQEVHVYDALTGQWTSGGLIPAERQHAVGAFARGRVHLLGGEPCEQPLTTTVWSKADPEQSWHAEAPLPSARIGEANGVSAGGSVGVVNDKIYVVGGNSAVAGGNSAVVDVYDGVTSTWSTAANMPTPRSGMAVTGFNGRLYAIGGRTTEGNSSAVEIYETATNRWSQGKPFTGGGTLLFATVYNGIVYVVAQVSPMAANLYAYDPATDKWSAKSSATPSPSPLMTHIAGGGATQAGIHVIFVRLVGSSFATSMMTFVP